MSVKRYRVEGEIMKKHFFEPLKFKKTVSAVKKEHALELVYAELGSRHRAKRHEIKVENIYEEPQEE